VRQLVRPVVHLDDVQQLGLILEHTERDHRPARGHHALQPRRPVAVHHHLVNVTRSAFRIDLAIAVALETHDLVQTGLQLPLNLEEIKGFYIGNIF